MTTDTIDRTASTSAFGFNEVQAFLFAEARALDDRQWDTWLTFYHADCPFWMPAWDDEDMLTEDPQNEMSLIYYPDKSGIEDRVFRIQTERSSSTSLPEPRTMHTLSNIEILSQEGGEMKLRFNWLTMTYRYGTTDQHWGTSFYTLDISGAKPLITNKKVVLKNDQIHHVIDVYHI